MRGWEKVMVVWTLGYMLLLAGFEFLTDLSPYDPWHDFSFGMGLVQNVIAMALTIRDLYQRDFPHPNQKLTWGLLITWTVIGWFIYLFKYAFKPRTCLPIDGSII